MSATGATAAPTEHLRRASPSVGALGPLGRNSVDGGTGRSILAAQVAGFDLVYMGTPFIATDESAAPQGWKDAVLRASIDDIELTDAFTGLPTSMIRAAKAHADPVEVRYSAGQSAACVDEVLAVATLVEQVERQFLEAKDHLVRQLAETD